KSKADEPPGLPVPPERSITMVPGGGETMLDMGDTPRTSSKPAVPSAPATPADGPVVVDPTNTIVPTPGAGETMLDLGPMGGHTPPKRQVSDMTTSVFPGMRKPLPSGLPKAPPEMPVLPVSSDSNP